MRTLETPSANELLDNFNSTTHEVLPSTIDKEKLRKLLAPYWPEAIAHATGIDCSVFDGGNHPCPKCGGDDRFNLANDGSGKPFCRQCKPHHGDGFGVVQWITGKSFPEVLVILADFAEKVLPTLPKSSRPRTSGPKSKGSKASEYKKLDESTAEIRNLVYSRLIGTFPLSAEHRKQLKERGLTNDEIENGAYFTFPKVITANDRARMFEKIPENLHAEILEKVPGIRREKIKTTDALGIPTRDHLDRFVSIRTRPNNPDGGKYQYIVPLKDCAKTSRMLAHQPLNSLVKDESIVRITEGEIKANVATSRTGILTLGVAGVSSWRSTIPICEERKPDQIRIAFDVDMDGNVDVAERCCEIWEHYTTAEWGPDVRIETWTRKHKGIDDAIIAGEEIKCLSYARSAEFVEELREKHGFNVPKLHKILDDLAENENPEDPARLARLNIARYEENHGGKLAYWHGGWWRYKSGQWISLEKDELSAKLRAGINDELFRIAEAKQQVEDYIAANSKEKKKAKQILKSNASDSRVNAVIGELTSLCLLSNSVEMPSMIGGARRRQLVSVQNGMIDLEAIIGTEVDTELPAELMEHTPDWFCGLQLPCRFDPNAKYPNWESYLHCVLDEPSRKLLQEWAGYVLYSGNPFQKFLHIEGDGGSGKSVASACLTALIGMSNISTVSLDGFGGNQFTLSSTIGKTLNVDSDVNQHARFNVGLFKKFASGELFQVEKKNKDPRTVTATAKVLLISNNRPRFDDSSRGLWRRMLLLKFDKQIPEGEIVTGMDDPSFWLESGELPGILNWALYGLRRLFAKRGFTITDSMQTSIDGYRSDMNPLAKFLDECVDYDPDSGKMTSTSELVEAYRQWARDNTSDSDAEKMSAKRMNAGVHQKFSISSERFVSEAAGRARGFKGIKLDRSVQ